MCTATWRGAGPALGSGYTLCFNRDESRERAGEQPARALRIGGVDCLAPLDGAAGGTWIGVNELGFAACLLNAYPELGDSASPSPAGQVSRGRLVLGLLDLARVAAVGPRLREGETFDLVRFRPFRLLALAPGEAPACFVWNGSRLEEQELRAEHGLMCSSAWDDAEANRVRRRAWGRLLSLGAGGPSDEDLLAFHAGHEPGSGAASVCMHRDDAATVSFARVRVTADSVELLHSRGAPCGGIAGEALRLRRRPAGEPVSPEVARGSRVEAADTAVLAGGAGTASG